MSSAAVVIGALRVNSIISGMFVTVSMNNVFLLVFLSLSSSVSKAQGPVVQSILSLTSSLRGQLVKYFMTL